MNRRDSLKALGLGTLSTTLLLDACKPKPEKKTTETPAAAQPQAQPQAADNNPGRQAWEIERDKQLLAQRFFTAQEMAAITLLSDIIIPKDDIDALKKLGVKEIFVPGTHTRDVIAWIRSNVPSESGR